MSASREAPDDAVLGDDYAEDGGPDPPGAQEVAGARGHRRHAAHRHRRGPRAGESTVQCSVNRSLGSHVLYEYMREAQHLILALALTHSATACEA